LVLTKAPFDKASPLAFGEALPNDKKNKPSLPIKPSESPFHFELEKKNLTI